MYTVEIYKADRRKNSGERLVHKEDYSTSDLSMLTHTVQHTWRSSQGYRYEIHETYVTRKNLQTGTAYQERYDTPYFCSPSRDAYWAM
jgi:hypothetical protein